MLKLELTKRKRTFLSPPTIDLTPSLMKGSRRPGRITAVANLPAQREVNKQPDSLSASRGAGWQEKPMMPSALNLAEMVQETRVHRKIYLEQEIFELAHLRKQLGLRRTRERDCPVG